MTLLIRQTSNIEPTFFTLSQKYEKVDMRQHSFEKITFSQHGSHLFTK